MTSDPVNLGQREESERLAAERPRYCKVCQAFTEHHTDQHGPVDPIASPEFVQNALAEARRLMSEKRKGTQ